MLQRFQYEVEELKCTPELWDKKSAREKLWVADIVLVIFTSSSLQSESLQWTLDSTQILKKKSFVILLNDCQASDTLTKVHEIHNLRRDQYQLDVMLLLGALQKVLLDLLGKKKPEMQIIGDSNILLEKVLRKLDQLEQKRYSFFYVEHAHSSSIGNLPNVYEGSHPNINQGILDKMMRSLKKMERNSESDKQEKVTNYSKYDLKNAALYHSAVGDFAHVNNHIPPQAAAADPGLAELKALFEQVNQRLSALEEADRKLIVPAVEQTVEAASAIQQGDESEEKQSFLEARLKTLYLMRQDIGEVVITSLASPAAGVALVLQKIGQKVKEELNIGEGQ